MDNVQIAIRVFVDSHPLHDYDQARKARAAWEVREKETRQAILDALGYDPDDLTPEPLVVETADGGELFKVSVGQWRGLNQKYLKERRPDVYAECEMTKATLSVKYDPF
ncbi:hypothetical protein [Streptomyces sp. NPDC055085]